MASKTASIAVTSAPTTALVRSPTPTPIPIEVPGSPILKAQLCAPPKVNNRKEAPKQASLSFIVVGLVTAQSAPFVFCYSHSYYLVTI